MKVISASVRLRVATAMMALWVPVAAVETIIVTRAQWWNLPKTTIEIWSGSVALISLPLALWMLAGKRWALHLTALFGILWTVLSLWVAFRTENPGLGFFTLLLMVLWLALFTGLKHEMSRSFFDPHLKWFQGLPEAIPGVACILNAESESTSPALRASRLDVDGAFVFNPGEEPISPDQIRKISEMIFRFKDREVRCHAKMMSVLKDNRGFGFQFIHVAPDARKELGDFIETMRGEGYVE
ncbi:MAG: hypothetical protein H7222_16690 [Methylotenera sp.]|nr:hypothetical protein [Oligoflexia bacterium]